MRRNWLLVGLALAVTLLLAYAWTDAGLEPMRQISQTVVLPGAAR
ncbi:MAG TPA: hypothetical protein VHG29_11305 [Novosphingobium sp.]|nr:hypothetical protein [Novosphingobium sp.]